MDRCTSGLARAAGANRTPETVTLELDDTEVRTGLRTKSKELLAFLLLHPDGVRRETATESLWPGHGPARSAARAKDALRSLRQEVETLVSDRGEVEAALEVIRRVLGELGVTEADRTTELYTDMVAEHRRTLASPG